MLYGVTNVFLYIESLRVVDLLRKGVYNLKVKVYQENEITNLAKPTIIQAPKTNKDYSHVIKEHEVLNNNCYSSKKFFVQYINEYFLFGNFISFQIELPLYNYYSNNLIVDFELIYYATEDDSTESIPNYSNNTTSSIYSQLTSPSSSPSINNNTDQTQSIPSPNEKLVSQQRIRINKAGYGMHQYIPITFSDLYFCLWKMTISTSLVDIKFRHQSIESLINFNVKPIINDSNGTSPLSTSPIINTLNGANIMISSKDGINLNQSSSYSTLPYPTNINTTSPQIQFGTSPKLLRQKISRLSLSMGQIHSSPLEEDFLNDFFDYKYPEVLSFFVESYYRLGTKFKELLSLLKHSQFNSLGEQITTIPALNIPPFSKTPVFNQPSNNSNSNNNKSNNIFTTATPTLQKKTRPQTTVIPGSHKSHEYYSSSNNNNDDKESVISNRHKSQEYYSTSNSLSTNSDNNSDISSSSSSSNNNNNDISIGSGSSIVINNFQKPPLWKMGSSSELLPTHRKKQSFLRSSIEMNSSIISEYIVNENNNSDSTSSSPSSSSFSSTLNNDLQNLNLSTTTTISNGSSNDSGGTSSSTSSSQNNIILKWKNILNNFQNLSEQITKLWNNYVTVFQMVSREYCLRASINYEKKCIDRWGFRIQRIVQYIQSSDDLLLSDSSIPSSTFLSTNPTFFNYKPFKIQHIPLKPDTVYHSMPIFFEHILKMHKESLPSSNSNPSSKIEVPVSDNIKFNLSNSGQLSSKHLFVFVHGLSGSSFDLRQFKNYFQLHFPNFLFLMCSSIEENTLEDIEQMGEKIAMELHEYLRDNNLMHISKISFLCHSLGGLVVRSALTSKSLSQHLHKLHSYISLSTPHLGTKFLNGASIVTPALWVWQKFTSSTCLKQLLMQDAPQLTDCYLYKLSQSKSLELFQYVFLISSEQDGYVPYHSARIEVPKDSKENSKHIQVLKKMVQNLLDPIRLNANSIITGGNNIFDGISSSSLSNREQQIKSLPRFTKINVIFEAHKGVDGVIGRSAHIRMLDQTWFMQMLVQLYKTHWEN